MRRAKIVCTIGPAVDSPEKIRALVDAGMDVARINRSHGSYEDAERHIAMVREAAEAAGRQVGVLVDLQGPKIRTGRFAGGPVPVSYTHLDVYKRQKAGGLLRYGIPEFKMEKHVLDRRLAQMRAEGTRFRTGVKVGEDLTGRCLLYTSRCV